MVTRRTYVFVAAAAVALFSLEASAQFAVQFWDREYTDDERDEFEDGFNLEECEANMPMRFEYIYSGSLSAGGLYVYIGSGCEDKTNRDEGRCYPVIENDPLQTSAYIEIYPKPVVEPTSETPACTQGEGASDVFFFILDTDADETILYRASDTINYDTLPPEPPVDITASYGESMIEVSWDVADSDYPEDWDKFRIVCFGGDVAAEVTEPVPDTMTDTVVADTIDPDTLVADVPDDTLDDGLDAVADVPDDTTTADTYTPDTTTADTATADTNTGDGTTDGVCPEGGFAEGDEFAESWACSSEVGSTTRSYDLTGLTNGTPYMVSVVAIDTYGNESVIGAVACATPDEVDDFWEVYKGQGGGDDGGFCFVATAAWGDYDHPAVIWLRALRDEVLEPSPGGSAVIGAYYDASPPAAAWLSERPKARAVTRAALWPAVGASWAVVQAWRQPDLVVYMLMGLVMCLVALRAGGFGSSRRRR